LGLKAVDKVVMQKINTVKDLDCNGLYSRFINGNQHVIHSPKFAIHIIIMKFTKPERNRKANWLIAFYLLPFAFCLLPFNAFTQSPKTYTSSEILLQLKKLKVLGSVLYIAAHPDDENNTLLPYLAKEKLYRTAYLSLTRGDGGQNLIGDEQGIELGLMRTQELLAARRVDGAEQYFTRAYEFGYSKSTDEALRIWDREKILSDAVWVIRKYQPDIIINRFPPDSRAGHGHHSASAVIGAEAYEAAADPTRFPEQFKYGVKPWKAKRLLWNSFNFGGNNTTSEDQFKIDIGGYNALLGKSYGELGAEARTMHKCQGEGRPRRRGQSLEYFSTLSGTTPKNTLMDDVDISWNRIKGGEKIDKAIDAIIAGFNIQDPGASVPALIKLRFESKWLNDNDAEGWVVQKRKEIEDLIVACSGLFVEAVTTQQFIPGGDSVNVLLNLVNRSVIPISYQYTNVLRVKTVKPSRVLEYNKYTTDTLRLGFSQSFMESQPYWLKEEMTSGMFTISNQQMIGQAENDPLSITLSVRLSDGFYLDLQVPIQYKYNDPTKGDVYKPTFITPRYLMYSNNNLVLFKKGENDSAIIKLQVNAFEKTTRQRAMVNLNGKGFSAVQFDTVFAANIGSTQAYKFKIGNYLKNQNTEKDLLKFSFMPDYDGKKAEFNNGARTIEYDHIPTLRYYYQDMVTVLNIDLKTVGKKIGYINGAGDKVHEALEAMGYEVKTLEEADVNDDNLKQFDAIVVGIRAYNVYEWLTNKNDIMNRYVENGGNLIVQYLKSNEVGLKRVKVGPYPFVASRTRVTEEDAKVNFLLPEHPALTYPNKITEKDFEGWVQERSTYHAEQLDSHFETPLGMNDTGEKESNGSLAIAKYGKGNFVYCSLVFFRQLPAGVPGAYRMLANLIALPNGK
jgi:LmbE family N-acetylglucosaminyl deacetylase